MLKKVTKSTTYYPLNGRGYVLVTLKILSFAVMQRVARVRQRELSYFLNWHVKKLLANVLSRIFWNEFTASQSDQKNKNRVLSFNSQLPERETIHRRTPAQAYSRLGYLYSQTAQSGYQRLRSRMNSHSV